MDSSKLTAVKDLLTIAKPLVDPLIAVMLAPKIKLIEKALAEKGLEQKTSSAAIEKSFKDYLLSAYERFCTMNVLVFPNQQILIKQLYQPLTIQSTKDYKNFKIDVFDINYIEPYERVLISDNAGMGKSTLMKWIGASIIEQKMSLPILLELKKLTDKHKIIDEICSQLGNIFGDYDKDIILQLVNQGQFTFLLDGFDETMQEFRESIISDLKKFVNKCPKNWFILTSRPDSALTAFGDFQVFKIQPLQLEESFELIKKYDTVNINKVGDKLIEDIKQRISQVEEFLVNPFLVSLLYKTYTYNKDIPSKKTTFYEEVYGALYKNHDLSKDGFKRNKKSGLDFQDFKTVTNLLAFETAKLGKVEYSEHELLYFLDTIKPKLAGINFKSVNFAEDIELNVPLFNREGNILKWAHKSLQDYFAASYISSSPRKEQLIKLFYSSQKSNYLNIIDFLYEMEYEIIRNVIVYEIAKAFVTHYDESYKNFYEIPAKEIKRRKEISFDVSNAFLYAEKNAFSNKNRQALSQHMDVTRNTISFGWGFQRNREYNMHHQTSSSFRYEIISILSSKHNSITKSQVVDREYNAVGLSDTFTDMLAPEMDKIYVLNDKKENPLNSPKLFSIATNLFISAKHSRAGNAVLDYTKCVQLINEVEKSKGLDKERDEFEGI